MTKYDQEETVVALPAPATSNSRVKSIMPALKRRLTTRDGLLGDFDYKFLFTPRIPFYSSRKAKTGQRTTVFFALDSEMPLVLGVILGLQHSLAMLAGIVTPPLIISGAANLPIETSEYMVSASLIACGILSLVQIIRFRIFKTNYYLGTGLISVVGTSFSTISVVNSAFPQMYASGFCPTAADGTKLACPDGYGALIGTAALCGLVEVILSFCPPKIMQRLFPAIVNGPVVLLIGTSLIQSGFQDWVGGSGCATPGSICPSPGAPQAAPWGSAKFVGLGFLVFVTIVLCEKWGAPVMKSCSVVVGLVVGCIVASACGYFDRSSIDSAPAVTFLWVHTFKLKVYGPIVLPLISVYITCLMETIGDVTASCDVSRQPIEGPVYESRIQGGVLADGINSIIAGLMTVTPMSTFAQNNGVISLTQCANRVAGYWCCFFLLVMGIFSKFAAALVAIPKPVLGGMTTFLFASVAVSGVRIISTIKFTRRDRFVLTCSLMIGFASMLVPNWFSFFFTYSGPNKRLSGFLDAIVIVMETPYSIAGFTGLFINQIIREEDEEPIEGLEPEYGTEPYSLPRGEGVTPAVSYSEK